MKIFTVGHSTRSLQELIGLLNENAIQVLADVRSFPSSRRYPHFNRDPLSHRLAEAGIRHEWLGRELGGYRKKANPDSPHCALRSPGFRNYADHMASAEFASGIETLRAITSHSRVAIMCAERLWWRCHRSLVSDYLVACCGDEILHILEEDTTERHRLHRTARLAEGRLVYDVEDDQPKLF